MRFATSIALSTLAGWASAANTVTFMNQDGVTRNVIFTGSNNMEAPSTLTIPGNGQAVATFANGFKGNFIAIPEGHGRYEGMLGEVAFQGWNDFTWFDISAIVNASDSSGVKMLWPAGSGSPTSGCNEYGADLPCANAYKFWNDDTQTKSTTETELICTLGDKNGGSSDSGSSVSTKPAAKVEAPAAPVKPAAAPAPPAPKPVSSSSSTPPPAPAPTATPTPTAVEDETPTVAYVTATVTVTELARRHHARHFHESS